MIAQRQSFVPVVGVLLVALAGLMAIAGPKMLAEVSMPPSQAERAASPPRAMSGEQYRALNVEFSEHAADKHDADAEAVRQCLNDKGPTMIWLKVLTPAGKDPRTIYVCDLPDGRWGIQIAEKIGEAIKENTAFIPKDGSWLRVKAYLEGFAQMIAGTTP